MSRKVPGTLAVLALIVGLTRCGGARVAAPGLFPMRTAWAATALDVIEAPLATDGLRIFVASRGGAIQAFDRTSGAPVWSVVGRPGRLAADSQALVVRQADGTILRLEPETGVVRWKAAAGVAGTLPPVIDHERVLVAGEGVASLDLTSGRVLWATTGPTASTTPAGRGPRVFVGESDGTLRGLDAHSGLSLWTVSTAHALVAPPLVDDHDRILLGTTDHTFLALSGDKKGKRIWRWPLGADVQTPSLVYEGTVLVATHENVLYALKRSNGHMIWRAVLPSRPLSGPLLMGSSVVLACQENDIVGLEARTGKKLGFLKTPAEIRTPPLVVEDRVYIGLRDRSVVALQLPVPGSSPEPGPSPTPAASPTPSPSPSPAK